MNHILPITLQKDIATKLVLRNDYYEIRQLLHDSIEFIFELDSINQRVIDLCVEECIPIDDTFSKKIEWYCLINLFYHFYLNRRDVYNEWYCSMEHANLIEGQIDVFLYQLVSPNDEPTQFAKWRMSLDKLNY